MDQLQKALPHIFKVLEEEATETEKVQMWGAFRKLKPSKCGNAQMLIESELLKYPLCNCLILQVTEILDF